MAYAIGMIAALFLIVLVVGAATGRVQLNSCCTAADPRRDLRMRGAYADERAD